MSPDQDATNPEESLVDADSSSPAETGVTLNVAWCPDEPWRLAQTLFVPVLAGRPATFGRGPGGGDRSEERVQLGYVEPRGARISDPLSLAKISRVQAVFTTLSSDELEVRNVGQCRMQKNLVDCSVARLRAGDALQFGRQIMLVCTRRPGSLPLLPKYPTGEFGFADGFGIVGESSAVWGLRKQIAFVASRAGHVLILGDSGTGKELVARAIHALSDRGKESLVSRNSATIPETLVDAELFGNARNYPNAGMAERTGLIGEADGGSLFLDEFAELPVSVQAHLLRVLDDGEYQRLGDATSRRSSFRLIAATNRPRSALKEDLLARFSFTVEVPNLETRREDIPLIARHLLRSFAADDPELAPILFPGGDASRLPRLSFRFMTELLRHPYRTNVRELASLMWSGISQYEGGYIEPRPAAPPAIASSPASAPASSGGTRLTPARIQSVLDRNNGHLESAWRELGLRNRYELRRLVKKHGLEVRKRSL